MRLVLLRHGETEYNRDERLLGHTDVHLSEEGIRHAEKTRELLRNMRFDRVYSSPLLRAYETAGIVSSLKPDDIIIDDRLTEIDYGPYEGMYFYQLKDEMFDFFRDPVNIMPPEGIEHISSLMERSRSFLDDLISVNDENVLAVTHGVMMRAFLGHITGNGKDAVWGMPIENCQVFYISYENGKWNNE